MRHWVLLATGGNQAYIFDTNRLRHAVGASQLILESTTTWLVDGIRETGVNAEVVLSASGVAQVSVGTADQGRALIRHLTTRMLDRAPGLELTGAVGPAFDPELPAQAEHTDTNGPLDFLSALDITRHQLAAARARRTSVLLRDLVMPFHHVCPDSGLPVSGSEKYGEKMRPASAPAIARSGARERARDRMGEQLGEELVELVPHDLETLSSDGWTAVVHADGNGVGALFAQLPRYLAIDLGMSYADYCEEFRAVSDDLAAATEAALRESLRGLRRGQGEARLILPLIVGGDDVTFVCHAAIAIHVIRRFLAEFHEQTQQTANLSTYTELLLGAAGMTASAGIAVIKPHHPFSAGYELAEELCTSAKRVKSQAAEGELLSSFDVHVNVDSSLRPLTTIRADLVRGGLQRSSGPFVVRHDDKPVAATRWSEVHDVRHLDAAIDASAKVSRGHAYDLRNASDLGLAAYDTVLRAVAEREATGSDALGSLRPVEAEQPPFVRVVDALLIDSIADAQLVLVDASEEVSA